MPELHPLLAGRWSPRGFDGLHEVGHAEMTSLIEAARWAPSADNGQPWRFAIGRRDDETHKRIFESLDGDDQRWAWRASALIAAGYLDADESAALGAAYDLGQAVAHLGVQAVALDLRTHQMLRFDAVRLRRELELPRDVTVHAVVAVGRIGDPMVLPSDLREREFRLRARRPIEDLLLT